MCRDKSFRYIEFASQTLKVFRLHSSAPKMDPTKPRYPIHDFSHALKFSCQDDTVRVANHHFYYRPAHHNNNKTNSSAWGRREIS
jgi:hypothetical protein